MLSALRGYLIRTAVDQAVGGWNAPMDPATKEFVYVPIPESRTMHPSLATPYTLVEPALADFGRSNPGAPVRDRRLPPDLASRNMHLDPDFA